MRFFKTKSWVLTALFALFGPFSSLAARICEPNRIAPMCAQIAPQCKFPCPDCCREASPNVALFGSVALPLPPQKIWALDAASGAEPLPANFVSPPRFNAPALRLAQVVGEIERPPPRRIFGFSFSCRAPPVLV